MGKEPKDENDPTGLRWFARRVAEMKWWGENSKPEDQDAPAERSEDMSSQNREDENQPPTGEESPPEGETS
jgi:hypothetical protein